MDESVVRLSQATRQLESELREELRLRKEEWITASEANRDLARYRFIDALDSFNRLLLHGKMPE